jgi:hypothetical protein
MPTKNEMLWRLEVNDPHKFTEWRPLWAFGDDQLEATQELVVELNRINAPVLMHIVPLSQIEVRISKLVELIRSEGAHCCRQESVRDMAESPMTARITMHCKQHGCYSFTVVYGSRANEAGQDDAALRRKIFRKMLKSIATTA